MKGFCSECGHEVVVVRSQHGAGYALKRRKLSDWHVKFLSWWISSPLVGRALTKEDLKSGYKYVDMDAINARISELKAWDLVRVGEKARYSLNLPDVLFVLNNGGSLQALKEKRLKAAKEVAQA